MNTTDLEMERTTLPTGAYELTRQEYDLIRFINCSRLKTALRSTKHLEYSLNSDTRPTSKAVSFGSACHTWILEDYKWEDDCIISPKVDRRTKAGKQEYAEFLAASGGRVVIGQDEFDAISQMKDCVVAHETASGLLLNCVKTEMAYIYNPSDIKTVDSSVSPRARKGLIDAVNAQTHVIADLKTTQDASPDAVASTVLRFGYHIQAAFYSHLYASVHGEWPTFYFVFVEKEPPHGILVTHLDDDLITYGSECIESGIQDLLQWELCGPANYNGGQSFKIACPNWIKSKIGDSK